MTKDNGNGEGCDYGFWPWLLGPFMGLCPALAGFSPAILQDFAPLM
jgi:hypothetical protein